MADKVIVAGDLADPLRAKAIHNGQPVDLTGATARFIMQEAGSDVAVIDQPADILNATQGELGYYFSTGETDDPGLYDFWFRVTFPEGDVTYGPASLEIVPGPSTPQDTTDLIVTPDQVYDVTTKSVSTEDIAKAQSLISALIDRDLFDDAWFNGLSSRDQRRLQMAVAFQAAFPPSSESVSVVAGFSNVSSISSGGQSISFGSGGAAVDYLTSILNPLAAMQLTRLSWRTGRKTLFASPYLDGAGYGYTDWTSAKAFPTINNAPIMRTGPPDENVWVPLYSVMGEEDYDL